MKLNLVSLLLASLIGSLVALPANAAIVFSENFDDITLTTDPLPLTTGTVGSSFTSNVTTNDNSRIAARTLGSNPLGAGNQFLEVIDGSGTTAGLRGPTDSTISGAGFYFRFDFFDPSGTETGINGEEVSAGGRYYLSSGDSTSTASRTIDMDLANGSIRGLVVGGGSNVTLGSYTEDEMHSVEIIGNLSAATINYFLGGSQSVAPGTYDTFLDGALLAAGDDVQFRNPSVTEVSHVSFAGTGSGSRSVTYFDDIAIDNAVPIPEPSSICLVGMMLAGIGIFRMQNRRH